MFAFPSSGSSSTRCPDQKKGTEHDQQDCQNSNNIILIHFTTPRIIRRSSQENKTDVCLVLLDELLMIFDIHIFICVVYLCPSSSES